jgi:hypothetical protein
MQTNIFRIYRQMKTALSLIVNSQPSSHVYPGSFNSVTGLLINVFANEWRSIGDGDPDLQFSRLEYMMFHNLEDEDSNTACDNSYSHSSVKGADVRGTIDEPAACTVWVGRSEKDRSGMTR